mgnify:CR=1 FL=1
MTASFASNASKTDNLLAGNTHLLVGRKVVIPSGQNLKRGALLGKVTANSKYPLSLSTSSDGSQTPDLVLGEDCDASLALAYSRGDFNASGLTLGASHTIDSIREGLRAKGITIINAIA